MSSTLQKLLKVREQDKRKATQLLARAQDRHAAHEAQIEETRAQLDAARRRSGQEGDPTLLSHYHSYQLRMEMERRHQERALQQSAAEVEAARDGLRHRVQRAHVIASLLERRAEEARLEEKRAETSVYDELAVQGWWRESA